MTSSGYAQRPDSLATMEPTTDGTPVEPPDDPDDWSDEQWLDWLASTDSVSGGQPAAMPAHGPRSTGGQMLYAAMFGLHQVIYGPTQEVTIVEEAAGEPDEPQSLEVHLEPDYPDESTVVLRPWLIESDRPDGPGGPGGPERPDPNVGR